jgi:hypothetical protein
MTLYHEPAGGDEHDLSEWAEVMRQFAEQYPERPDFFILADIPDEAIFGPGEVVAATEHAKAVDGVIDHTDDGGYKVTEGVQRG